MDLSTLLVVLMLIMSATLASYALSNWSSVRGVLGIGWAATSIGTTLLLVAAALVVLTFVFARPLWQLHLGMEQRANDTAAAVSSQERSLSGLTTSATAPDDTRKVSETQERHSSLRAFPAATTDQEHEQTSAAALPSSHTQLGAQLPPAFNDADPWAATRCVRAYPTAGNSAEWKIENDCDVPVGVIVSSCAQYGQACGPNTQVILPAKVQRPIPLNEQIVQGFNVRHTACFFASSAATVLIGAPSEQRSTPDWRSQFDAALASDSCLMRVQSYYGGSSVP